MEENIFGIRHNYDYLFRNEREKKFALDLIFCLIFGKKPENTPELWQDAEILVRYMKRDVWHLGDDKIRNGENALGVFSIKYILEHLKRDEVLDILQKFFAQEKDGKNNLSLLEMFQKRFAVPVQDMFVTQEKIVVSSQMLKDFDRLFEYPAWTEFDESATEKCFKMILSDELNDKQISYFLGANDDMRHYDKWFEVAKHVLLTTKNPQTFWVAGDVLNIVWIALPDDEKLQKWFRDQVFEIFWSRVGSAWPIINKDKIDFSASDEMKITKDAIGWLLSLKDLRERVPELPESVELNLSEDEDKVFSDSMASLLSDNDGDRVVYVGIEERFFALCDLALKEKHLEDLEYVKKKLIEEYERWTDNSEGFKKELEAAIRHAKKYIEDRKREGEVMRKYILEHEVNA